MSNDDKYVGPERRQTAGRRYNDRKVTRGRFILYAWIITFTVFTALVWHDQHKTAEATRILAVQGHQAKIGVCTYKADLTKRLERSKEFLKEHPGGIPEIPKSALEASISDKESALKALNTTDCAGP